MTCVINTGTFKRLLSSGSVKQQSEITNFWENVSQKRREFFMFCKLDIARYRYIFTLKIHWNNQSVHCRFEADNCKVLYNLWILPSLGVIFTFTFTFVKCFWSVNHAILVTSWSKRGYTWSSSWGWGEAGDSLDMRTIWLGSYVNEFFPERVTCKDLLCSWLHFWFPLVSWIPF